MNMESSYNVGKLTEKVKKTLKKFSKRKKLEAEKNEKSTDFRFATLNEQYWYFEFEVKSGLYKGQKHIVEFKLVFGSSPDIYVYPLCAPKCTFITPIWHPNISEKGTICLDTLKEAWSPSMHTSYIISSIKLLLDNPEPSSAQNPKAANMFKHKKEYIKKINSFYEYNPDETIQKLFDKY
jgi:ubiquitin-protein ligase